MAEIAYTANVGTAPKHTVTRATGGSALSGSALFVFRSSLTKNEVLEAFRAIRRVINRDALHASDPADYPTTGSVVR